MMRLGERQLSVRQRARSMPWSPTGDRRRRLDRPMRHALPGRAGPPVGHLAAGPHRQDVAHAIGVGQQPLPDDLAVADRLAAAERRDEREGGSPGSARA